jgi:hypothetical protein
MSSDYRVVEGIRRSLFVPQTRVLKREEILQRLAGGGGIGAYFQPWDFDFLKSPVHVPGGAILDYVAATKVVRDTSNATRGTFYAFTDSSPV